MVVEKGEASSDSGNSKAESDEGSFSARIAGMPLTEKIQLAMKGDKSARALLIRDSNKVVQVAVISNGRLTEDEVASFANYKSLDGEVLRKIAGRKDWLKVHEIRAALVKNPKTPTALALKMLPTLLPRELKMIAKNKQAPPVIATAAGRFLATKKA